MSLRCSIAVSALPNRVDIQWQGAADDPSGAGIATYQIDRTDVGFKGESNLPHFTDSTVQPGTTYTYNINAMDYSWNNTGVSIQVTTPPAGTMDARRVGVRPTGSYWGGLGENIDTLSGNLNFTLPLLKAQGRGGLSLPINLSYNSEQWRQDSAKAWNLGTDVGYGYGWKLLAGSITPYYAPGFIYIDHYVYTDSSGAEYRLDHSVNNVWTSTEGIYVSYDVNARRLSFNDGTFWVMGCTSAGTEEDGGTMYPTLVQDSNGNQILIRYQPGQGVTWRDSSARIWQIEDVRAQPGIADPSSYWTYDFEYDTGPGLPHLLRITNNIGTAEGYTVTTTGLKPLLSPFGGANLDSTYFLQSVSVAGLGLTYQFQTNDSGQLTRVTFPYGGYQQWDYANFQYANQRSQTEVSQRYLSKDGATPTTYTIGRHPADNTRQVHRYFDLRDPDQQSEKPWFFNTSGPYTGLISMYEERQLPSQMAKIRLMYTWTTDTAGNPYISSIVTSLEPDTSNQIQKQVDQVQDAYGNVTQTKLYNWNSLTTPARTYDNVYLSNDYYDANYRNSYIRNRLVASTLTAGTQALTLVQNWYDGASLSDPGPLREHDPAYGTSFYYRGNVVGRTDLAGSSSFAYDIAGNPVSVALPGGVAVTGSYQSSTNFAAPSSITSNTFTNTLQWSSFLGLTQNTGPNGDSASTLYDGYAQPASTTAPTGAVTTYAYSTSPPWTQTVTVNGRWTRKKLDGFGRPILIENGNSTTLSQVDMVYDSCACSPIGKLNKQSLPHAPGATPQWVVYNYDGLGRTVSVVQPDSSTKHYDYLANMVTVTDEAANWKKYTMDAFGNLTQVLEPDPDNPAPATYTTTYAYDQLNHLTTVTMPRPSGTQTRTFNYGNPPGAFLLSATNPENGTVTYTYGTGGTLATKTDAKNQQIRYTYDSYLRLTRLAYYQTPTSQEDTQARVDIYYDSYWVGGPPLSNTLGRMTWRQYTAGQGAYTFKETYEYTQPGQLNKKTLSIQSGSYSTSLAQSWTYDNEGRVTSMAYPSAGLNQDGTNVRTQSYSYGYDIMGRLSTMQSTVSPNPPTNVVTGTTYGPAGELLTIAFAGRPTETRTYNSLLQLIGLNESTFTYPAGLNNGRIQSEMNTTTGEQVTYAYDKLNRLISAVTTDNPNVTQWGQQFVYDGFGNLREKNVIKGTAPSLSVLVDAATNRLPLYQYDANGNQLTTNTQTLTYNYENRLSQATTASNAWSRYSYDPDGRRVYSWDALSGVTTERVYVYGLGSELTATYILKTLSNPIYTVLESHRGYFGSRLTEQGTNSYGTYTVTAMTPNHLGGVGKNYPYGETGSTGAIFATYTRDSGGLDYAVNRWYSSTAGRFTSPDPYLPSGGPADPRSWNRYSYVRGDPANRIDAAGLIDGAPPSGGGGYGTPTFGYSMPDLHQICMAQLLGQYQDFQYEIGNKLGFNAQFLGGWGAAMNACNNVVVTGGSGSGSTKLSTEELDSCLKYVQAAFSKVRTDLQRQLASFWSMESTIETALTKGSVVGALEAVRTGEVLGVSVSGFEAAVFGGVVGGVLGTTIAVVWGPVINYVGYSLSMTATDRVLSSLREGYNQDCQRRFGRHP
jgi:RHS repeat-associated protein